MIRNDKAMLNTYKRKTVERCMDQELSKGFGESNIPKNREN
jgi:hypothetical protein